MEGLGHGAGAVGEAEREALEAAMAASGGNKVLAARSLGIGRTTLYRRLGRSRQS